MFLKNKFTFVLLFFFLINSNTVYGETSKDSKATINESAIKNLSIGETFAGEELTYRLSFMIFDDAATGKVSISKGDVEGEYIITLFAETSGFIGWLLKHRKDVYTAVVYEVDNGKRFRTKSFKKDVIVGKKRKTSTEIVDYDRMVIDWEKYRIGYRKSKKNRKKTGVTAIPEGKILDCPLTAFFNLRFGAYGEFHEGAHFKIDTLPKKGYTEILIDVFQNAEKDKRGYGDMPDTTLARINLDKELFGSLSGIVDVLFDKELIPVRSVAKDLLLMGDVKGKLIHRKNPTHKTNNR